MHDNTKLLLLIFLTLTIGTVAIILSLRPTKNTEAYPDRTGKMGWGCNSDKNCISNVCGQFDPQNPPPRSWGTCCGGSIQNKAIITDRHKKRAGITYCTGLGKGTKCAWGEQCNSGYCHNRKCL